VEKMINVVKNILGEEDRCWVCGKRCSGKSENGLYKLKCPDKNCDSHLSD
jgi:hypothetical protein